MQSSEGVLIAHTFEDSTALLDLFSQHNISSTRVTRRVCFDPSLRRKDGFSFFKPFFPAFHHGGASLGLDGCQRRDAFNHAKLSQLTKPFVDAQGSHAAADRLDIPVGGPPFGRSLGGARRR